MAMDPEFKIRKVHTVLDLVISAVVLAAGVGLYFVLPGWGILFSLIGILLFTFYKRANMCVGDKTLLKEKTLDLATDIREQLTAFLSGQADIPELTPSGEDEHLYLEVYYNADASVAYAQLYDVADSHFDPATPMRKLTGAPAASLIAQL